MIALDIDKDELQVGQELAARFPDEVSLVEGRAIDGTTLPYWSMIITAAGLAIPAIRAIVVEMIKAKRHKSVSIKGVKIQGYSEAEVKSIMAEIQKASE